MNNNTSIYIPRVFNNIKPDMIKRIIENLNLGLVDRIDVIPRKYSLNSYMAFIYMKHWNMENAATLNLIERIYDQSREARIIYDDPWYWIVLPNKNHFDKKNMSNVNVNMEHNDNGQVIRLIESLQQRVYKLEQDILEIKNKDPISDDISYITQMSNITIVNDDLNEELNEELDEELDNMIVDVDDICEDKTPMVLENDNMILSSPPVICRQLPSSSVYASVVQSPRVLDYSKKGYVAYKYPKSNTKPASIDNSNSLFSRNFIDDFRVNVDIDEYDPNHFCPSWADCCSKNLSKRTVM
jgi:hypothetical protein